MIGCAVVGASGAVGQRFLAMLDGHPLFRVEQIAAGPDRVGKPFSSMAWRLGVKPTSYDGLSFSSLDDIDTPIIFSALPSDIAGPTETRFAQEGRAVFTNASAHRMDPDVPLVIAEVNGDAMERVRGRKGFIVANGNCSGIILTLALAPLHKAFGLVDVDVVTQQALSGAGWDGVDPADIADNILPLIPGEEEKLETEPQKMLDATFAIRATCTRVNVTDGHFETVHVRLSKPAAEDAIRAAFSGFPGLDGLPTAPHQPIVVMVGDRPQPRPDRLQGNGMAVTVGRLRVDGDRVQFVVLGHNTIRGAAGQSLLNAELAARQGLI